jgi:hypothetical protein
MSRRSGYPDVDEDKKRSGTITVGMGKKFGGVVYYLTIFFALFTANVRIIEVE